MRTPLIAAVLFASITSAATVASAQDNTGNGNHTSGNQTAAATDGGGKNVARIKPGTHARQKPQPATSENQAGNTRGAHANSTGSHTTGSSLTTQSAGRSKGTTGK